MEMHEAWNLVGMRATILMYFDLLFFPHIHAHIQQTNGEWMWKKLFWTKLFRVLSVRFFFFLFWSCMSLSIVFIKVRVAVYKYIL